MKLFGKFLLLFASVPVSYMSQAPTATINVPTASLCTGHTYSFSSTVTNSPTSYRWAFFPSTSVEFLPDLVSPSINLKFGKSGVYSLSLSVANGSGVTTSVANLSVTQNAVALFNASLNAVGYPNQMILTNYSSNYISSQWLFSDGPSDNNTSTIKNYTTSGNYSISLVAYGNNACNDTSIYRFRIADSSGITMPNIFTPNEDSINDIFKPVARGIANMKVWIYDRYGTSIYSWDGPQGFWDGRNTAGEPLSPSVYFYVLEATGFDGKSYKLKGTVTLLR